MKKGFTLVELSIVLVIIGLLVGGILVGKSLVDSARINAQVKQIQQFDIAAASFSTRFKGLPGDSNKTNSYGNNDRDLDDDGIAPFIAPRNINAAPIHPTYGRMGSEYGGDFEVEMTGERAEFWKDLSISGMKFDNMPSPSANTASGLFYNQQVPKSKLGESGVFATRLQGFFSSTTDDKYNVYVITDNRTSTSNALNFNAGAATTTEAMTIDKKIDDNNPATGDVASIKNDFSGVACLGVLIGSNNRDCDVVIKILSQTTN